MDMILKNANVFIKGAFRRADIAIDRGHIVDMAGSSIVSETAAFDLNNCFLFPGLVDVHVHLREPGFSYKETIFSGTSAAAAGGFTAVCSMPNISPVPDSAENLEVQMKLIREQAVVHVFPYGAITRTQKGQELSDMAALSENVVAFSDDGCGIQHGEMMEQAMVSAKKYGKIIAAHCEDNILRDGGYIHKGKYAREHGHRGISSESEWRQIERDLELAEKTGCAYHVCHISTKEGVELIRRAKARGVDVTCETAPHYLVLDERSLQDDGRFKMNPPLRSSEDREALLGGIDDGTIDMIATDHAPHSAEEKSGGLRDSLMGVVGLETSFPVMYTELVRTGRITLERLIELMQVNPSARFGTGSSIAVGEAADLTVFRLDESYTVQPELFKSKGRSTPFAGRAVFGRCVLTMVDGKIVYSGEEMKIC